MNANFSRALADVLLSEGYPFSEAAASEGV